MDEERKAALLQQISEKRNNGRTDRETSQSLQDQLRFIDRELEEDSGASNGTLSESGEGTGEPTGNARIGGNGGFGLPFSDGQTNESDSGSYQDSAGIEGDAETTRPVKGTEKKPGGLNIVPSKREKKVRDEESRRKNAEKQRAFRARKKAASSEESADSANISSPARRSVLDLLPKIEKTEKAVRKAFSEAEARAMKPLLVSAMLDYFSYADELLYATVKGHPRVEIWSTIDDEECGILADVLIARGKKSAAGAAQIQAMVDVHKNLKVGMILAPRFYQSFRLYMDNGLGINDGKRNK
jgi:hypothetical protein